MVGAVNIAIRPTTAQDLNELVSLWVQLGAAGTAADARFRLRADAEAKGREFIADRWLRDRHFHVVVATDPAGALAGCMTARLDAPHPVLANHRRS
jgi:hypothetical protein